MRVFFRQIFLIVLLSALAFTQPLKAQAVKASTSENFLVDAVQLFTDGQYARAKAMLSAIVEVDPDNDAAYYYMGLCDIYLNNRADAEKELNEAARLDSTNYWYKDRLAVLYSMLGNVDRTISIYESLIRDYPKKSDLYYSLVNLYAQQERMDDVLSTLDEIEKIAGKDESTTLARYEIFMRQDKADEAFNALAEFNEDFSSPQILSMMGDAKLSMNQDTLALEYYNEALLNEADYPPALLGKSDVFRMRRDYASFFSTLGTFIVSTSVPPQVKSQYLNNLTDHMDGRFASTYQTQLDSLYEASVSTHPSDTSLINASATYFYRSGRREKANDMFKSSWDLHPDDFNSAALYVQALSYSEDWERLRAASEEAFRRFPQEPAFINMMILADYNRDDFMSVISDSRMMVSAFPKDSAAVLQAYSTMGDIYHQLGDEKNAFKAYDRALRINPEYAPVLNNYAYYLSVRNKKLKKAYSMSRITVEQEPDNATYLDTFAWILHQLGRSLEAKSFFKHAMLYGGKDSAVMLDHYAEVLFSLKEYDLAKVIWGQAMQKNQDNEVPGLDAKVESRLKLIDRELSGK